MDPQILGAFLRSSKKFIDSLESENNIDEIVQKAPAIDSKTTKALAASLTDLISFRVSSDAPQKYAARIHLIEIIREWVRPPNGLASYPAFYSSAISLDLCNNLIKKYITKKSDKIINDDTNPPNLIILIRTLFNMSTSNPQYLNYLKNITYQIIDSDAVYNSYDLVQLILSLENELELKFSQVEKLYEIQAPKLIEEPLIDCLLKNLNNYENNLKNNEKSEIFWETNSIDELLLKACQSPKIFQITCAILKDLFIKFEYSKLIFEFSIFLLKNIAKQRMNSNKSNLIILYPVELQSCTILLRIDPREHTKNTRKYLLDLLRQIYIDDKDTVLIIMMHFPQWLETLSNKLIVDDICAEIDRSFMETSLNS